MSFKQADRHPDDGPISVNKLEGGRISVTVSNGSEMGQLIMSEYNASRVVGALSLLLGIRINVEDSKRLKM